MRGKINKKIGTLLLENGIITGAVLEQALAKQESEPEAVRRKIGEILIEDFAVERELIFSEIASIYGFKEINISKNGFDEEQLAFISETIANASSECREALIKHSIIPFKLSGARKNVLEILAADPTEKNIQDLALKLGYDRFETFYAPKNEIVELLEKTVSQENEFLNLLNEMSDSEEFTPMEDEKLDEAEIEAEIHKSRLTNLVEGALVEAVRSGASDIHVVPREGDSVEFMFRQDGKLRQWHLQTNTRPEAISAVFKDRSNNVDRFDRESAQDGFIQRDIDGYVIRFRVSILPIVGRDINKKLESIVIRVLDDRKVITNLKKLGLQNQAEQDFLKSISKPQGMVILTGPTGSGKSTTLVAALSHVTTPEKNILTVEDPVEYMIDGVRQLKLNRKMDFEQALKAILRHDPDIVMVGEIRDKSTADIAIKLSNTGHLTFSTLHTNDAPGVISRLYKMGVEPFLIAYAINIVVAQRLVRSLCPHCKQVIQNPDGKEPKVLGMSDEEIEATTFYEAVGCDKCSNGYKGRVAIHEALLFTKEIRKVVLDGSENIDEDKIRELAVKNGMKTLRMSGIDRIKQGLTTCQEVAYATVED